MEINPRIMIAVGLIAAILLYILTSNLLIAGLVLLLGLGGAFLLNRQTEEGGGGAGGKGKSNRFGGDDADEDRPRRGGTTTAAPPAGGGLPTWSPEGLDTWTPPADADEDSFTRDEYASGASDEASAGLEDTWGSWTNDTAEAEPETLDLDAEFESTFGDDDWAGLTVEEETVAVDDEGGYASFEEVDEVEVEEERPAPSGGFSFSSAPAVINEEVASDDDIMAASAATELHVAEDPAADTDGELAKLLAKVQARLSAYE